MRSKPRICDASIVMIHIDLQVAPSPSPAESAHRDCHKIFARNGPPRTTKQTPLRMAISQDHQCGSRMLPMAATCQKILCESDRPCDVFPLCPANVREACRTRHRVALPLHARTYHAMTRTAQCTGLCDYGGSLAKDRATTN